MRIAAPAQIRRFTARLSPARRFGGGAGGGGDGRRVATLLSRIMESDVQPHVTGQYRLGDIRHNFADIAKLDEVMGFRPSISLEEGLQRFCDWVSTQPIPEDMLDKANAELRARKFMA